MLREDRSFKRYQRSLWKQLQREDGNKSVRFWFSVSVKALEIVGVVYLVVEKVYEASGGMMYLFPSFYCGSSAPEKKTQ